jgi:Uma2 family endonuclease
MEDPAMVTATTRAANGLHRRVFTVAEVEAMQRKGIFHPDEKFELVEGEIVPMQSKSPVHELIKNTLIRQMIPALSDALWLGVESSVFLSDITALDPDIIIYPTALNTVKLRGPDVILAIEVSHSTLAYDRGLKARLYARHGVPEYWVIDAKRRITTIHTGPQPDGTWAHMETRGEETSLTHASVPGFSLRLADV